MTGGGEFVVGGVRAAEPLKAFLFRAREKVAESYSDELPTTRGKPACVMGAKACDLRSLEILNAVLDGPNYSDPLYVRARDQSLIIGADCTEPLDVCFCRALHLDPHPTTGFDLNLSTVDAGYVVEEGSDKGRSLLHRYDDLFDDATDAQGASRDQRRSAVAAEVDHNLTEHSVPDLDRLSGAVRHSYDSPLWEEEAACCVECGACNAICPTCHCFLLYDRMADERLTRFRLWDSCLIKDFATVAGGANPRPRLWMRLRNRFEKKFDFFPAVNGMYACTGCGRCIRACPAEIDIRRVLARAVTDGTPSPQS